MDVQDHLVTDIGYHLRIPSHSLRFLYRFGPIRLEVELGRARGEVGVVRLLQLGLAVGVEILCYYLLQAFLLCLKPDYLGRQVGLLGFAGFRSGLELFAEQLVFSLKVLDLSLQDFLKLDHLVLEHLRLLDLLHGHIVSSGRVPEVLNLEWLGLHHFSWLY